jgi:putative acetyltransferase
MLRAARLEDAESIAEMFNGPNFRWGTMRMPFETVEGVRKRLQNRADRSIGVVAVEDGRVIGEGGLYPMLGRRAHVGSIGLGVRDGCTGRGVGRAILGALVDAADNWVGLTRLELTVYVDNAPAIALYKAHGFEIEGTLRDYVFREGEFVDAYMMGRLRR